jgi:hypothetical protein
MPGPLASAPRSTVALPFPTRTETAPNMLWLASRHTQHVVGAPLRTGAPGDSHEIASKGTSGFVVFGPYEKLWYNKDR